MTESCKTDLKLPTWHSSPARWEEGTLSMQLAVSLCNVKMLGWSFGKARLEEIIEAGVKTKPEMIRTGVCCANRGRDNGRAGTSCCWSL